MSDTEILKKLEEWHKQQMSDGTLCEINHTHHANSLNKINELRKADIAERVVEILKKVRPSCRGELSTDVLNALDSGDTTKLEEWVK